MAKKSTFRLPLPVDKPVETYTVQLANGVVVTRTVDELRPHPSASDANRG